MNTALELSHKTRSATKHDLDIVSWVVVRNSYSELSALAIRYLALIHSFIQLGFTGVQAPIGALTDTHRRVFGIGSSERSTYRALAELEKKRFIRRQTFRVGPDTRRTIIHFLSHSHLHLPERQHLPIRSQDPIPLRSSDFDLKSLSPIGTQRSEPDRNPKKTRATCDTLRSDPGAAPGARPKKQARPPAAAGVDRFASWEEPICYSIRRVAPAALLAAHRDLIRSRAKGRQTAIDWSYWRSRWQTLPIAEREQLAGEFAKLLLTPARKTTAQDASISQFLA